MSFTHNVAASTLYSGTIGTSKIVLELDLPDTIQDGQCRGTYFYLSRLHDIEMYGTINRGIILLGARHWEGDSATEMFRLTPGSGGGYAGVWTQGKHSFPVQLHPLDIHGVHSRYDGFAEVDTLRENAPLSYVRSSYFELVNDSVTVEQGHRLQWMHFKHSSLPCFQILDGYNEHVLHRINRQLFNVLLEDANNEFTCVASGSEEGEWSESVTAFFGPHVVSVSAFVSYYCGGAHPDDGTTTYNFNGTTGDALQLEDITSFGAPISSKNEEYSQVIGERIVAMLEKLYPNRMKSGEDECDYTDEDDWRYCDWGFTDKGLLLSPSIPHVNAPCREPGWTVIPYRVLAKYRNKKLKLTLP